MAGRRTQLLRQLLGARDASGERVLCRLRLVAAPWFLFAAYLFSAAGSAGIVRWSTAVSFAVFAAIAAYIDGRRGQSSRRFGYVTAALDLIHAYTFGLALLLESGSEKLAGASGMWVAVAVLNGASILRAEPRVCVFSGGVSLVLSFALQVATTTMAGEGYSAALRGFATHGVLVALPAAVAAFATRRERSLVRLATLNEQSRDEERARLEWRLKVADRMVTVGTMAAGVAHEVNNPLTYVLGNLEWALQRVSQREDLDDVRDVLAQALDGAVRVQSIVAALRTFSRVEDGPMLPVDLQKTLAAAITMASSELRHRAQTEVEVEPGLATLGTEAKLGQVFLNLIVNAAQAIEPGDPEHHWVHVRGYRSGERAVVEVSDSGMGIAPENLGRIFDPFYTTKPVGTGTGLGLSICQSIVAEHQGRIEVESVRGRGTTFRVWLDVSAKASAPAVSTPPPPKPERGRVLVIDDDRLVAQAVTLVLGEDHDVDTVSSAAEALAHVQEGRVYDAIVCDLMMPGMGGIELYYELEVTVPAMARRMLFATGGAFTPASQSFVEVMAKRVVAKPFRGDDLRRKVARMVEQAWSERPAKSGPPPRDASAEGEEKAAG
jgi:signal transduction histidine kinase/CheY-like chemotaxis protein